MTIVTDFDASKFQLGNLCRRKHEWGITGKCLRYLKHPHCVQCMKDRARKWEKDNPEKKRERSRIYGELNRERINKRAMENYYANKTAWRERSRKWEQANPEKTRAKARRNRKTLKGKARKVRYRHERRARLKASRVPYTTDQMMQRLKDFDYCCAYCGDKLKLQGTGNDVFHWDHFQPLTKGGIDCITNLLPACSRCNINKSNHDPIKWYLNSEYFDELRWIKIQSVVTHSELSAARREYKQLTLFD